MLCVKEGGGGLKGKSVFGWVAEKREERQEWGGTQQGPSPLTPGFFLCCLPLLPSVAGISFLVGVLQEARCLSFFRTCGPSAPVGDALPFIPFILFVPFCSVHLIQSNVLLLCHGKRKRGPFLLLSPFQTRAALFSLSDGGRKVLLDFLKFALISSMGEELDGNGCFLILLCS